MRNATVAEVNRAIEAAQAREPGGAVAFDGDGTLWAGDIGEDFFVALVERGVHDVAREPLSRDAVLAHLDGSGTATELAHRIHSAYLAGSFPEERVCEIMTWAAAGMTRAELAAFCDEVIVVSGVRERLHGEAVRVVEQTLRAGIEVYIVSASPCAIVEAAAHLVGIAPSMVVAAREQADSAGVVQCAVERPIPYGGGKVTRLRERIGARPLYAAFGDNAFDVPMLCEARLPVAIRPKARLVERAVEVPELVVLERV